MAAVTYLPLLWPSPATMSTLLTPLTRESTFCTSCAGQPDALSVALGQVADDPVADVLQPAALDGVVDAPAAGIAIHLAEPAAEVEVLLDFHFGVERHVLGEIAEAFPDLFRLMEDV